MFDSIEKPKRIFEHTYWLTAMDYASQHLEGSAWMLMRATWREVNNQTPNVSLLLARVNERRFLPEAGILQMHRSGGHPYV